MLNHLKNRKDRNKIKKSLNKNLKKEEYQKGTIINNYLKIKISKNKRLMMIKMMRMIIVIHNNKMMTIIMNNNNEIIIIIIINKNNKMIIKQLQNHNKIIK